MKHLTCEIILWVILGIAALDMAYTAILNMKDDNVIEEFREDVIEI
jgi:hypothetical protein